VEKKESQKPEIRRQMPKQKRLLPDGEDKLFQLTRLFNSLIKEAKEGGDVPDDGIQHLVECRDRLFNCHIQRQQGINQSIR
jgi:hypothetical protein